MGLGVKIVELPVNRYLERTAAFMGSQYEEPDADAQWSVNSKSRKSDFEKIVTGLCELGLLDSDLVKDTEKLKKIFEEAEDALYSKRFSGARGRHLLSLKEGCFSSILRGMLFSKSARTPIVFFLLAKVRSLMLNLLLFVSIVSIYRCRGTDWKMYIRQR